MQVVDSTHNVCFDVDDTLIMWEWYHEHEDTDSLITIDDNGYPTVVLPNQPHIELLKRYKAKGKTVIVWSQSGHEWAERVVRALGLEKYVDDLHADEWMEYVYKWPKMEYKSVK
jgi:beta-phosphoglucomutase-like phosphatase (HAD superfamily)